MSVSVLIGGDVCPIGRNEALFQQGDAPAILNDLAAEFERSDLAVINLECPLIRKPSPSEKRGPTFGVPDTCVRGLKAIGIDVAGLANNHIMDHGPGGLRTTIDALEASGIGHVGAGENLDAASQMVIRVVRGIRVGILALAEHEFGIASPETPGANPLSPIDFVRHMRVHRDRVDYLIVLLHGGKEYYPYPSPELQKVCRFMVEEGTDAILCQHSHCPGCYEHYRGGHIVYGQGNFLFDRQLRKRKNANRGFLVRLSITAEKTAEMVLLPYIQSPEFRGARRMPPDAALAFRSELEQRSARAMDDLFVAEHWRKFCRARRHFYFSVLRGHDIPMQALNRITRFTDLLYSKRALLALLNVVRCEAHRETLLSILSDR